MGFRTIVVLNNDAMHDFEKDTKQLGDRIIEGHNKSNYTRRDENVPFISDSSLYGGYISVEPSRHADDYAVYSFYQGCLVNMNPYGREFDRLAKNNTEYLEKNIKLVETSLKEMKARLKKMKQEKKENVLTNPY